MADFWIIRDGEKVGPLPDFEIRRRIEIGELGPEDPVWSEGMKEWTPLGEVERYATLFEEEEDPEAGFPKTIEELVEVHRRLPPPLPSPLALGRRFWARWLDLLTYMAIWWVAMWLGGRDLKALLLSQWLMLIHLLPWFLMEAVMLHHFGTTPGKALMGISVVNLDGGRLSYGQALRRSLRVLIAGIGFGVSLISPFCQLVSWYVAKKLGMALWDRSGGHRVMVREVHPIRYVLLGLGIFVALQVRGMVLLPVSVELLEKDLPWIRQAYENFSKLPTERR